MTVYSSPRVVLHCTTMATKPKEATYICHPWFKSRLREPRRNDDNRHCAPWPTAEKVCGEAPCAYDHQRTDDHPKQQHSSRAPDDRHKPPQPAADACFNCGKVGHSATDCPRPKQSRDHVCAVHTEVPEVDQDLNGDAGGEDDLLSHQEDRYVLHDSYQGGDVEEVEVDVYDNDYYSQTVDTLVPKIQKKHAEWTKPPAQNIKDEIPNEIKSGWATKGSSTSPINKELWDRPIPQQSFEWFHDPQMPREWNELVSSIREHECARQPHIENVFRIAGPKEISKPHCFKHIYRSPECVIYRTNSDPPPTHVRHVQRSPTLLFTEWLVTLHLLHTCSDSRSLLRSLLHYSATALTPKHLSIATPDRKSVV